MAWITSTIGQIFEGTVTMHVGLGAKALLAAVVPYKFPGAAKLNIPYCPEPRVEYSVPAAMM
jgi:hypothetical protein